MAFYDYDSIKKAISDKDSTCGVSFESIIWANIDTEEDAEPIVDAINKCTKLEYLSLVRYRLSAAAARAIAQALEHHPKLKVAKLTYTKDIYTFCGKIHIEKFPALSALSDGMRAAGARLRSLDLSDNGLSLVGVEALAALLESEVCSELQTSLLQELRVNSSGLGATAGRLLADALSSSECRLRVFAAGRNRLQDDGAKELAAAFKNIGTLEEVDLRENSICYSGIKELSEAFKRNPKLASINLSGNIIGPEGAAAIADAIPSLKNLRSIDLENCLIKREGARALAKAFKDKSHVLEYLDLSNNWIGTNECMNISRSIKVIKKLKRFDIEGNGVDRSVMNMFYQELGSKVFPLWPLNNTRFKKKESENENDQQQPTRTDVVKDVALDSSAQPIVDEINKCVDLQHLCLSGTTLDEAAAQAVARALEHHPELKEAKLSGVFRGTERTEIRSALSALSDGMRAAGARLRSLDLSDNGLGLVGVEALATLLESEVCSQLQELRLNYNNLSIASGRLLAEALSSSPCRLRVFDAGWNTLGDDGAKELAAVFENMGTLEEVDLRGNSISYSGAAALSQTFKLNSQLGSINLRWNDIGPDGAAAIADALPSLKNLKSIDLGNCSLNYEGATALAKGFKDNSQVLEYLDLSSNGLDDEACMDVVYSIKSPEKLKKLILCALPIVDEIKKCPDLQRLSLSGKILDVATTRAIGKALEHHPELKVAEFSHAFSWMKRDDINALSALSAGMRVAGARLRSLDLSDNCLGARLGKFIAELLGSEVCNELQELRLNRNSIFVDEARLITKALASSPCRLRVFAAGRNALGDDGVKELAAVFENMGTLEEIELPSNYVTYSGITALSEAFKRNPRLGSLNLSDIDLGPDGATAFTDALHSLKNLRSINLKNCKLGSEGGEALAKALKHNSHLLEYLDLTDNWIGDEACMNVVDSITAAGKLKRLILEYNGLSDATNKKIFDILGDRAELDHELQ